MLSNYVGEDRFLKGVSLYLKKKLFANSKTHDLWEGIGTATRLNITELMENWITKVRFSPRCKLQKGFDWRIIVCLFD
jgi:aminopeptidase 2